MANSFKHISAISLFVEDLQSAKTFYQEVFAAKVLFEDQSSVAFSFDNVIINLLMLESAGEIITPSSVAARDAGSRFQLSVWVENVDAVCSELRLRGIQLTGPQNRAWGMRTINFVDPAGHSWEVAQKI